MTHPSSVSDCSGNGNYSIIRPNGRSCAGMRELAICRPLSLRGGCSDGSSSSALRSLERQVGANDG